MKKEERDYRSLDRERMYSIFSPLDGREAPQPGPDEPRVIISGRGAWMLANRQRRRRP